MMASATVLPQDNLRSYILSALQRIYRDLETVSSSIDRNITEHVLYRLEHVIVLILQCQSTWPNFIDEETVQIIFKVYQEVERSVGETWEIVTEAKSGKPGRPEVSIPEEELSRAPTNQKYRHDQKCRLLLSPQPIQIATQSVQVNIIP